MPARCGAGDERRNPAGRTGPDPQAVCPRAPGWRGAKLAVEYALPRHWIVQGIVAALRYHHPQDPPSLVLKGRLSRQGLPAVLEEICRIDKDSPLADEIQQAWNEWPLR